MQTPTRSVSGLGSPTRFDANVPPSPGRWFGPRHASKSHVSAAHLGTHSPSQPKHGVTRGSHRGHVAALSPGARPPRSRLGLCGRVPYFGLGNALPLFTWSLMGRSVLGARRFGMWHASQDQGRTRTEAPPQTRKARKCVRSFQQTLLPAAPAREDP